MATKEKKLATEVIADLSNQSVLLNGRIEELCEEISRVNIVFKSVYYSASVGRITREEADDAMSGIQTMIDVLLDNAKEISGISSSFIREVVS